MKIHCDNLRKFFKSDEKFINFIKEIKLLFSIENMAIEPSNKYYEKILSVIVKDKEILNSLIKEKNKLFTFANEICSPESYKTYKKQGDGYRRKKASITKASCKFKRKIYNQINLNINSISKNQVEKLIVIKNVAIKNINAFI